MSASLDHYKARADAYAAQCGLRVRHGRLNAGMSQADLAVACFAPHPASISHWESGRFMPAVARQFAIADALALPMSVLWGHDSGTDVVLDAILADRGSPVAGTGSIEVGVNLRTAALATHYVSIECQHDHHGPRCRRGCPECSAPCRCWCHVSEISTGGTTLEAGNDVTAGGVAVPPVGPVLDMEAWGA